MGKAYSADELAQRTFWISMAGVLTFVATVFFFVL
jgi:hypothetical protein